MDKRCTKKSSVRERERDGNGERETDKLIMFILFLNIQDASGVALPVQRASLRIVHAICQISALTIRETPTLLEQLELT